MVTVTCITCKKEFDITPSRFSKAKTHSCSKECRGKYFSLLWNKQIEVPCASCQKPIFYKPSALKKILTPTCSKKCASKAQSLRQLGKGNSRALNLNEKERFFWEKAQDYKAGSKLRKLEFDLDYKFLMEMFKKQEGKCHYTNYPLKIKGIKSFDTLSLDRVDSSRGYLKDNVVFCLLCVNTFKSNHDIQDILKVFEYIYIQQANKETVKIILGSKDAKIPTKAYFGDAGFDLYSIESGWVSPKEAIKFSTGLKMHIPIGSYGMICDRSSLGSKGIKIMGGVCDSSYRGEIIVCLCNMGTKSFFVEKGDKIAQMIFQRIPEVEIEEVSNFEVSERGEKGFGSSGTK